MSHDIHPGSPDPELPPVLATTAWVFDMMHSEGVPLLPREPEPGGEGDQPGPLMVTLTVIALIMVIVAIVELL
ncbi:MAG: hypothetical protein HGB28_06085 [Oscillochloris sp.]|nr:hypothetical protein [Oscillochloris sp.]